VSNFWQKLDTQARLNAPSRVLDIHTGDIAIPYISLKLPTNMEVEDAEFFFMIKYVKIPDLQGLQGLQELENPIFISNYDEPTNPSANTIYYGTNLETDSLNVILSNAVLQDMICKGTTKEVSRNPQDHTRPGLIIPDDYTSLPFLGFMLECTTKKDEGVVPGSVLTMKIPKEIKLSCKPNETNIYSIL
jgi:hypothetical protein